MAESNGRFELLELKGKQGRSYELLTPEAVAGQAREDDGRSKGGQWQSLNKYALGCALLASLNSTLLGYDIGVIAGAVLFIKEDLGISEVQEELLVGSLNIVSLLGAASAGRIADAVGRRWTMAIAALFFLVGAGIMGVAPHFGVLMAGRLLEGIGVGFALMIAPVYTAEVSPASSRGLLVSLPEIFINFGILLGYMISYFFAGLPASVNWRLMLGIGMLPALALAFGVTFMPESPRWLVMQNRISDAEVVLRKTSRDEAEASVRLQQIMDAAGITVDGAGTHRGENSEGQGVWRELLRPTAPVRRMLVVALGVQFFQQASGIDATVYYSPVVFSHAGISGRSGVLLATILVGLSKTLFILVATVYLDRLGRRPLLLTSAIGMTFSLLALAVGFLFLNITPTKGIPDPAASSGPGFVAVLAILAICSYVAFFSVGFGPIVWVLTSEIFPLRLRAQAMGLAIVVNRLASGTVALTFLSMARAISIAGTFFLFSAIAALSAVFVYTFTPETKGRTLEEIARFFEMDSDRSQASYSLELGNLPHDGVGVSSPRIRKPDEEAILMQPGAPPAEDEDDLVLLRHDSLMAPQSGASRKELMMKVKAIKKQGQNSSASSRSQSQRPPPETFSVPPRP